MMWEACMVFLTISMTNVKHHPHQISWTKSYVDHKFWNYNIEENKFAYWVSFTGMILNKCRVDSIGPQKLSKILGEIILHFINTESSW